TVEGVTLRPGPLQERLPIWIGGNSPPALRRAARFDGWFADTVDVMKITVDPEELAAKLATVTAARSEGGPFEVARHGATEAGAGELPAAYAAAGATWWFENVNDMRGTAEAMLERVAAGPARRRPPRLTRRAPRGRAPSRPAPGPAARPATPR